MKSVTKVFVCALTICSLGMSVLLAKDEAGLSQPLSDHTYVEVYTFVGRFIEEASGHLSQKDVSKRLDEERRARGTLDIKPLTADMGEGEMAGLLRLLRDKDARYEDITLYGKDGVGVASTGLKTQGLILKDRPDALALGFVTQDLLSGSRLYRYDAGGHVYEERVSPVFKNEKWYALEKREKGELIGYMSYIARVTS
ncbi:MAG: hypothetical protein C0514_05980 [Candidatus Puniceispirillum sp.]|nr:hypothetical protein [Candidatus Puniceispirillum sp.]